VITKKYTAYTETTDESGLAMIYSWQACCTQAGQAHAAGRGGSIDRWQHSIFCYIRYRSPPSRCCEKLESSDFDTGTV